jgi:glycosyltransferase involved in cell wall biosynthesis
MIKFAVCVWNAERYIKKCIESIKKQKDENFEVYIIDDLSDDYTNEIIRKEISDDSRFKLITNTEKKYKLRNLDDLISTFDDDDIVIELDGDDYLFDDSVVGDIQNVYSNDNVWLTNGSFVYTNGTPGFSSKCNPQTIRTDTFTFSHLRTWKSFLWKQIPKSYLQLSNGEYFKSAPDTAYSFALLELAGNENYVFLPKIYYVYNANSPYNEHKPDSSGGGYEEQSKYANISRNKPKLTKYVRPNL